MTKLKVLLLSFILFIAINSSFSKDLKIYLKNLHRQTEYAEHVVALNYWDADTFNINNAQYLVKFPNMKQSRDTAFLRLSFNGKIDSPFNHTPLGNSIWVLVGNFKNDTTYLWADLNNNLDFTDDNAFYSICKANPIIYISLENSTNSLAFLKNKIKKVEYRDSNARIGYRNHLYNDNPKIGFKTTECDFWFNITRLNIVSSDTMINNKRIQIGILDQNFNGIYNDIDTLSLDNEFSDRIVIGKYEDEIISGNHSGGAISILPDTYIPINGIVYKLIEVDPTGKYMVLRETNKKDDRLKKGNIVPDLEYSLFDGSKTSLQKQIVRGKYNLIDVWALWCKGCIQAIPKFKHLDSLYFNKFNIIGLYSGVIGSNFALEKTKELGITWSQGILTNEMGKILLCSEGLPYYILINPEGKIEKFNITLKEVEEILRK